MKTKFFAFLIGIVLSALQINAYSQNFTEDFEGDVSLWSVSNGIWEIGNPSSGPGNAFVGVKCAATILDGNYPEATQSSQLISPVFTVPTASLNPRLRIQHWFNFSHNDYGKVQIKVNGTATWVDLSSNYIWTCSGVWSSPSMDLSSYAGQDVQIAFYFYSGNHAIGNDVAAGWYVDEITIETGEFEYNEPETWENGLGDWYVESGIWEIGTPSSGPGGSHEGYSCAATVLGGNYAETTHESRLVSPVITVPDIADNPRLRFQHWYNFSHSDYAKVQVKVKGTSNWISLSDNYTWTCSNVWSRPSLDLSQFAGNQIELAFYIYSGNHAIGNDVAAGWYVDEITIETGEFEYNEPETWENGLGDWYVESGIWEIGTPSSGPGGAHEGYSCAATVLGGNYAETTHESRLVSPVITVPEIADNPRLRFQHWYNFSHSDHAKVQVKVKGTSNWISLSDNYTWTCSNVWSRPSLDLSQFAGNEIELAFYIYSGNHAIGNDVAAGWYVDEITIETGEFEYNEPETWENGLGDWYVESGIWEIGTPSSGPGGSHEGYSCAATVLGGNYAETTHESRLVSPVITVPEIADNPRLRFQHWYNFSHSDHAKVQVKVKGTSNWISLSNNYAWTCSNVWSRPSLDLSQFAGDDIEIAFYIYSGNHAIGNDVAAGWYIDEITIETGEFEYNEPETWETGLGDWYVESGIWEIGTPSSGPGGAHEGNSCAATVLGGNYAETTHESRLVSPVITVPEIADNPRLRFQHWYNFSHSDLAKVQVKVKGTTNWISLSDNYTWTCSGVWSRPSLDLSQFAGDEIELAFYIYSGNHAIGNDVAAGWYIDEITIETGEFEYNEPETWENGLGDWYVESGIWEIGTPSSGPGGSHEGYSCAATVLGGNYAETTHESRLVSPVITVPELVDNPRLRFQHWYNFSHSDHAKVQVKVKGTSNWISLSDNYTWTCSGIWSRPSLDLSQFAGDEIELAFYIYSGNHAIGNDVAAGWYIDDIAIDTGAYLFNNTETWECNLGDWWIESGVWEIGSPSSGPKSAYEGTSCAATVLNGNFSETTHGSRLVSPYFTIFSDAGRFSVEFWHWFSFSHSDYGIVQVREKGTSSWVSISDSYTSTSGSVWSKPSLDISDYIGKEIQLGFYFYSGNHAIGNDVSSGWYIDNVTVFGTYRYPDIDAGEDLSICEGESIALGGSPTLSNGYGNYEVIWSPEESLNDRTVENPVASPRAHTNYTVTLKNIDGCISGDDIYVTVNPIPTAYAGMDTTICQSDSLTIGGQPAATGGTAGYSYQWSPTLYLSDQDQAHPLTKPQASIDYILTVIDSKKCSNTDTIVITVNPLPEIFAGGNINLCENDSVVLGGNPTVESDNGPFNYSWTPHGFLNVASLSNPTCKPKNNVDYILTVTDKFGCVDSDTAYVTVNPYPIAHAGLDVTLCRGQSVVLGADPVATGGTQPYSYSWFPGNTLDNSEKSNPLASPTDSTLYTVEVSDAYGCSDSSSVHVFLNENPDYTIEGASEITPNDIAMVKVLGDTAEIDVSIKPEVDSINLNADHYIFYISPESTTEYLITVNSKTNSCYLEETYLQEVKVPVLSDRIELSEVSIYPNPSNGLVKLVHINGIEKVEVYNMLGYRIVGVGVGGVDEMDLDLSILTSGVYILNMYSDMELKLSQRITIIK